VFDWNAVESQTTGKVTLDDYDFEVPKADQKEATAIPLGKHDHKNIEHYHYPTRSIIPAERDRFTRVRMESKAIEFQRWRGVSNIRTMGNGQTFQLKNHPRVEDATEILIIGATHILQVENDYENDETQDNLLDERLEIDEDNKDTYRCLFEVIPKKDPYRAPQVTPWPEMTGLQTAVVTGPSGEEIFTDKDGRIKVQCPWDRVGKFDAKTTCWVRCVMPWTGKNWGMISIPRIGQEVVIQFEDGNPDRPFCTGMLYNADTMPPYALDANKTQTGIVTRSTLKGTADTFHELIFEDKKDAEFIRLQSERDSTETIKNTADITMGLEPKDEGNLHQTVHKDQTEIVKTGDLTVTVEKGNEIRDIKTDQTETIGAKRTQDIGADSNVKIGSNSTMKVSQKTTIDSGTDILIKAGMSITLKVGGTSMKLDASGVTVKGPMLKLQANAMAEIKSPMTTVKGDGLLILKGGLTMIN
jgi:type VI secretion system secreted protein VgrG